MSLQRFFLQAGIVISCTFSNIDITAQITPEHISKIKAVTSSNMTKDGKYVIYTVANPADPKKENAGSKNQLFVMNTADKISIPYFTNASVGQVQIRPKNGTITFLTKQAGDVDNAIYEMNIGGGEARKLFSFKTSINSYEWNQDGDRIVFTTLERAEKPKTSLTYSPTFFEEEFGKRNAYVVNVSSGSETPKLLNIPGEVYMIKWSKDGTKIAISAAPTSSVDDSYMKQQVMIVDAYTRQVVSKINNEGKLSQIEWSPDNQKLAIVAAKDINDPTDGCILIVNASGGKPQLIDGAFQGKYENITWDDANKIHFLASVSTATAIGELPLNTSTNTAGERKYSFLSSQHHITSFQVNNNKIVFTANTPTHPTEVFLLDNTIKKSIVSRLTNTNPWLDGLRQGKQEVVSYKTRDGKYSIEGILIYPIDYKEGTKYPLITVVHGGPEAHYSNGWLTAYSMPGQMGAAQGYAVFYPNYRGSTGRGTDFTYSSQRDAAGAEFDDIVDGVDYLINKGIADKDRIGVTGGSYGGYASAWMSTYYSDRFAAAVMFVGISNNISKFGTSDIPNEMYLVHSRKHPWEDWKFELERSPIYYVDRAKTPILIMHGAEDPRVHPTQSMELYRHLKVRKPDVPVRLIYYPGEGHGNTRSGSRYDYNLRMMQWFDTYLKSGNAKTEKPNLDLPE